MRRWVSNSLLLLGGVVLGSGAAALFSPATRDGLGEFGRMVRRWETEDPVATPAPGVIVRTLATTDVPDEVVAWGRLVADRSSTLAFRTGGSLQTRPVEVGHQVTAGDTIATLDATVATAAMHEAAALLAHAKSDLARLLQLGDAATAAEREAAQTAVAVRTALVSRAHDALGATEIAAPFDGVVSYTGPDAGTHVGPGVSVARVDQVDPMRLELALAPHRVPTLRAGMRVRIAVDGLERPERIGTLSRIPPSARLHDGLFVCEVLVQNPDGDLRAGYVVRALIERGTFNGVVALPRSAVEEDAHGVLRLALIQAAGDQVSSGSEQRVETIVLPDAVRLDDRVLARDPALAGRLAVIAGPRPLPNGTTVRAFRENREAEPRVASGAPRPR